MILTDRVRDAYSATGERWQAGPGRVYDRLAEELIARSPRSLTGATVIDVGAGTGAATRAARQAGAARITAIDVAPGMVAAMVGADMALVGDARALPVRGASADAVVAAFSYNHLDHPAAAFAESHRVLRRGGVVIVGTYAADDDHPVKAVVETLLAAHGWQCPGWYGEMKAAAARMATPDGCRAEAAGGGFDATVHAVRVPFADLTPADIVEWRLGMAHVAPFVAGLDHAGRAAIRAEAVDRLAGTPPLVRSILITVAVVPRRHV